jgi:cell division GTPase FtsZ
MSDEPEKQAFDVVTPDIPMPEVKSAEGVKDEVETAFQLCFVGVGQGGGRLAESVYKLGYRRVCAINTARQDLAAIQLPEANKLCIGGAGAGKNPQAATALFADNKENALDFMRRAFGPAFDRILICAGAGGGTGAGMIGPLINTAYELQIALKIKPSVGAILALPKNSEGKKPNENAYFTLESLVKLVEARALTPLIILDNERINQIHPGLAVGQFWSTANSAMVSLLHLFNEICTKNSSHTTFDRSDLGSILDSGIIVFGAAQLAEWTDQDLSLAVRDNLTKNILSGGLDLATGTVAGVVFIGGPSILNELPYSYLDHAFGQFNRLLRPNSTVHRGIYTGSRETLTVYTAIGGLARPIVKLEELRKLGDVLVGNKPGIGPVLGEHA